METMDLNCWGKKTQCLVLKNYDHVNYTVCTLDFAQTGGDTGSRSHPLI